MSNLYSFKQLVHYINFHLSQKSYSYNTISGIISPFDIKSEVKKITKLLGRECITIEYNKSTQASEFLLKVATSLFEGKVVFIFATTLKLDPVTYDQLIHFREKNEFSIALGNEKFLNKTINENSKLFLVSSAFVKRPNSIHEICDYVLNLEGDNTWNQV